MQSRQVFETPIPDEVLAEVSTRAYSLRQPLMDFLFLRAFRPDQPDTVIVCGDAGVHVSADLGATWESLSKNLPHVMFIDLVYHAADQNLYAASYGRSIWRLAL